MEPLPSFEPQKPKRKREAKLKSLIDVPLAADETQVIPKTAETSETTEKTEKPKAARKPRKKKFVVSKFDKTIAKLVVRGERSAQNIRDALRVDAGEFEAELSRLCEEGLLVRGKFDNDYLSFTVKGFDVFSSFFKKTLEKAGEAEEAANAANVVWDARQTLLKTEEEQREKEKKEGMEKDVLQRAMSEERELFSASLGEKEKEIDLEDAFKKGAPNGAQAKPREQKEQKEQKLKQPFKQTPKKEFKPHPPLEVDAVSKNEVELKKALEAEIAKGAAMRVGETEVCELCRAPFKIAVGASAASAGATAKYGHCFCGAAYHKDCYETLAADERGGNCVRCGKKLKLAMDARSEEAVKQLKNVF